METGEATGAAGAALTTLRADVMVKREMSFMLMAWCRLVLFGIEG